MKLGLVATYMSESMVSGFTCGVAIHVVTSQMKNILGIKIQRHNGVFKIIRVSSANFYVCTIIIETTALPRYNFFP